eukprot:2102381-Rhodomonas_salina.1
MKRKRKKEEEKKEKEKVEKRKMQMKEEEEEGEEEEERGRRGCGGRERPPTLSHASHCPLASFASCTDPLPSVKPPHVEHITWGGHMGPLLGPSLQRAQYCLAWYQHAIRQYRRRRRRIT